MSLEIFAQEFNLDSQFINVYVMTMNSFDNAFASDVLGDLTLVQVAIGFVAIYCIFFLGSCSPIHFRSLAALVALLCVALAYSASYGLATYLGGKTAGIHSLLPFLLIGIGVDDAFVLTCAVDQTDPRDSIENRMRIAFMHAGASITITSLTNVFAFLLGMTTSLPALSNFCFFAALGILMLYFTTLTVFAPFLVWDLRR
jgi:Niemann-Pick C1 protein